MVIIEHEVGGSNGTVEFAEFGRVAGAAWWPINHKLIL